MSYADVGVSYGILDEVKRLSQKEGKSTSLGSKHLSVHEISKSRGESAYVWEEKNCYRAFVMEGLGTKNLIADEMESIADKSYYGAIAKDTVAMIVNDLIVVGATPQVITAYFAVGSSGWFSDKQRASDLVKGWAGAFRACVCVLVGGVAWFCQCPTSTAPSAVRSRYFSTYACQRPSRNAPRTRCAMSTGGDSALSRYRKKKSLYPSRSFAARGATEAKPIDQSPKRRASMAPSKTLMIR